MKVKAIVCILGTAFAMNAMAQHDNFKKAQLRKNTSPLQACINSNAALDKQIDEAFAAAKKAGQIDAKEEAEFKAMEANIAKHRDALGKDGFSIADCNAMTADYNKEKAAVAAMGAVIARKGSALTECRAKNGATDREIDVMFASAKKDGLIDTAEQAEYKRLEANIKKHRAALSKNGYSLADCQLMAKDYATEKAAVEKMILATEKSSAALGACKGDFNKAHNEVLEMIAAADKAGKLNATEKSTLRARENKLARHKATYAKDGFSVAECNKLLAEITAEKALVDKLSR